MKNILAFWCGFARVDTECLSVMDAAMCGLIGCILE